MANQLRQQIEQISREKNINPDVIIAAIEDAILTASKKYYKSNEDLRSRFNNETGQIEVFAVKQIVETVEIAETQISLEEAQKLIPEAEVGPGDRVPQAHRHPGPHRRPDREAGDLPEGPRGRARQRVRRVLGPRGRGGQRHHQAPGDGRLRGGPRAAPRRVLPRKEQSRAETYQTGDRVRVAIVKVLKSAKGPQVVVSRTDPALLDQAVRDGGARDLRRHRPDQGLRARGGGAGQGGGRSRARRTWTRWAPASGMKGTRVQSIIRELRGEKIDIVEWSDDPDARSW